MEKPLAHSYSATPGKTTSAATEASATGGGAPQTFGKHPSVSSKRPSAVHLMDSSVVPALFPSRE